MSITDWPPRSEKRIADPTTAPLRNALDVARAEAKAAWDAFEAERDRVAASDVDLTDVEALTHFDDLYRTYEAKSAVVEELQGRWEASLTASRNGHGDESGKAGKSKLAKTLLDVVDRKALVSPAGAVIAPEMLQVIIAEALRDRSILPLYTQRATTGDEIRYLQESAETLAAAPVAPGAAKPVSVLTTQVVSSPVRTIATVSEAIDRQTLMDFQLFSSWIEGRLRTSVQLAIEDQTLNGNGTAPNLRGVVNTAGVLVSGPPAAGENSGDAIADALALLEADNVAATAIVVHPSDYWALRVTREGTGATAGGYLVGDVAVPGPSTLWGVPLVRSTAVAAGQAIVADWRQATLATREDVTVAWAEAHSDLFVKNQVVVRVESRVAFAVAIPGAFCVVDLVA